VTVWKGRYSSIALEKKTIQSFLGTQCFSLLPAPVLDRKTFGHAMKRESEMPNSTIVRNKCLQDLKSYLGITSLPQVSAAVTSTRSHQIRALDNSAFDELCKDTIVSMGSRSSGRRCKKFPALSADAFRVLANDVVQELSRRLLLDQGSELVEQSNTTMRGSPASVRCADGVFSRKEGEARKLRPQDGFSLTTIPNFLREEDSINGLPLELPSSPDCFSSESVRL
jgi:hypothetical protein